MADRSQGPYVICKVGIARTSAIALSMHSVGFVSVEMGRLRPLDLSMSLVQSKGTIVQSMDSSVGCASVYPSPVVFPLFISVFARLSHVVIFTIPNVALVH